MFCMNFDSICSRNIRSGAVVELPDVDEFLGGTLVVSLAQYA